MGLEADCTAIWKRRRIEGRALLETNEVIFKGPPRVKFARATLSEVHAADGRLRLVGPEGTLTLELGAKAVLWAEALLKPKPVIDKLGVRPTHVVSVLGVTDPGFRHELAARAAAVHDGRVRPGSDLVFLAVMRPADLARLETVARSMARNGGVWAVWVKGRPELGEDHIRAAAIRARLVDVKVVAFSSTHSALKLVIPVSER